MIHINPYYTVLPYCMMMIEYFDMCLCAFALCVLHMEFVSESKGSAHDVSCHCFSNRDY